MLHKGDDSPQVVYPESGLEVSHPPRVMAHYSHDGSSYMGAKNTVAEQVAPFNKTPTVCGMRRQSFWFLIALAVVVVAASVGGSIGGTMAVRNAE